MSKRGLIIGGALQGLGAGIIKQADSVRERALKQMEIDAANAREAQRQTFEAGENAANRTFQGEQTDKQIGAQEFNTVANNASAQTRQRESDASAEARTTETEKGADRRNTADIEGRRGMIVRTFTDQDTGEEMGVTAGGDTKPTGHKAQAKDTTAKQKLAIQNALTVATEEKQIPNDPADPSAGQKIVKTVNVKKYAAALRSSKDTMLIEMAGAAEAAGKLDEPLGGEDYQTDFDPNAGDEPTDTAPAKTGTRGLTPPADSEADNTGAAPAADATATPKGTQASPHRPQTKTDMDGIKSGEYFVNPSDGKIYRKK